MENNAYFDYYQFIVYEYQYMDENNCDDNDEHVQLDEIYRVRGFDQDTLFLMKNQNYKCIKDIESGDILYNNVIITSKITSALMNSQMYTLNNIMVSAKYYVKYNDNWITVENHPESKKIENYSNELVYGLNTSNKKIIINELEFCDWDNIYGEALEIIYNEANVLGQLTNPKQYMYLNIHKYLDVGFYKDVEIEANYDEIKRIIDIEIGDLVFYGGYVYGLVQIETALLENYFKYLGNTMGVENTKLYHLLVVGGVFLVNEIIVGDYNHAIDFVAKTCS